MERVPQLPLLMKKKPARIKKELNVVITMKAKKTKRDDDEFNKEKVITAKAKKEKDVGGGQNKAYKNLKDVVITTKVQKKPSRSKKELEKDVVITTKVKKKPSRSKKELEKDVVITTKVTKKTSRSKKTATPLILANKEKDEWKQVDTKKEKDLRSSPCKEEEDETTQYCSCCGASRVQPGAVRCEACGIYN